MTRIITTHILQDIQCNRLPDRNAKQNYPLNLLIKIS